MARCYLHLWYYFLNEIILYFSIHLECFGFSINIILLFKCKYYSICAFFLIQVFLIWKPPSCNPGRMHEAMNRCPASKDIRQKSKDRTDKKEWMWLRKYPHHHFGYSVFLHLLSPFFLLKDQIGPYRSARWRVQWGSRSRVPGCQGVGLQGPRGSRVRSTGSQGVKEWPYRVPGGLGVGLQGPVFLMRMA